MAHHCQCLVEILLEQTITVQQISSPTFEEQNLADLIFYKMLFE